MISVQTHLCEFSKHKTDPLGNDYGRVYRRGIRRNMTMHLWMLLTTTITTTPTTMYTTTTNTTTSYYYYLLNQHVTPNARKAVTEAPDGLARGVPCLRKPPAPCQGWSRGDAATREARPCASKLREYLGGAARPPPSFTSCGAYCALGPTFRRAHIGPANRRVHRTQFAPQKLHACAQTPATQPRPRRATCP